MGYFFLFPWHSPPSLSAPHAAMVPMPPAGGSAAAAAEAGAAEASRASPDTRELFGLSGDTYAGSAWQGSQCTAATREFKKWWPSTYPGEWKMPNGMLYPFVWKLKSLDVIDGQVVETWDWEWIETPGLATISEVEAMLRNHYNQQQAAAQEAQARAAATAAGLSALSAAARTLNPSPFSA